MKTETKIKLSDLHLNDGSYGLPKNPRFIKDDLRLFAPAGFLRPEECTPETVFLPDRPDERILI